MEAKSFPRRPAINCPTRWSILLPVDRDIERVETSAVVGTSTVFVGSEIQPHFVVELGAKFVHRFLQQNRFNSKSLIIADCRLPIVDGN